MADGKESVVKQIIVIAVLGAIGWVLLDVSHWADMYFPQNQAKAETDIHQDSVDQEKR